MRSASWTSQLPDGTPLLTEHESWEDAIARLVPLERAPRAGLRGLLDRLRGGRRGGRRGAASAPAQDLEAMAWMPATRYQGFWSRMDAFSLPSFYDGRIRVNLAGREASGTVQPADYRGTLDTVARRLTECRDPTTGREVVDQLHVHSGDPFALGPSEADLSVVWAG